MKKAIPNCFTATRLLLTPIVITCIIHGTYTWALTTYCIGAAADFFDGFFAKKWNFTTPFGSMLDACADKIFVISTAIALMNIRAIYGLHSIPIYIIVYRECFIASVRMTTVPQQGSLQLFTRFKTGMQMLALGFVILSLIFPATSCITPYLLWVAAVFTIASVKHYWPHISHLLKL